MYFFLQKRSASTPLGACIFEFVIGEYVTNMKCPSSPPKKSPIQLQFRKNKKKINLKISKKMTPPFKKKSPAKKIISQIQFHLKIKKINLKISKNLPQPKKIPPPPKKFQKIILSQFQFRLKKKLKLT